MFCNIFSYLQADCELRIWRLDMCARSETIGADRRDSMHSAMSKSPLCAPSWPRLPVYAESACCSCLRAAMDGTTAPFGCQTAQPCMHKGCLGC